MNNQRFDNLIFEEDSYYYITVDCRDAIRNYLLYGYHPGGFLSAMMAFDYTRALYNADSVGRNNWHSIATWIRHKMPVDAVGDYDIIDKWCYNIDGVRSVYLQRLEKEYTWSVLGQKAS